MVQGHGVQENRAILPNIDSSLSTQGNLMKSMDKYKTTKTFTTKGHPKRKTHSPVVINNIGSSSPTCTLRIGKMTIDALLDSGADMSCLQGKWAKKLENEKYVVKWDRSKNAHRPCQSANGQQMKTLGMLLLKFKMGNGEFEHNFLVVEGLTQECLFGTDFMTKFGITMDFNKRTANVQGIILKLGYKGRKPRGEICYLTLLRRDLIIKPECRAKMFCSVEDGTPPGTYLITPLPNLDYVI